MSELKDKYREEFNKDIYHENPEDCGAWCYTAEYVQWLEKQVKLFAIPVDIKYTIKLTDNER